MLNQDIRRTAFYIFRNSAVPAIIVAGINTGLLLLIIEVAENLLNGQYIFLMILRLLAIVMFSVLADYFAMRSWLLGKCRFEYLAQPITTRRIRKKFVPLSVAITVIYCLLAIPLFILAILLVLGLLSIITDTGFDMNKFFIYVAVYVLIVRLVTTAVKFAIYIFASGAQYSAAGTLWRGLTYFIRNLPGWLWFNLTVNFVPAIILAMLKMMFTSSLSIVIMYIPVTAYLMIAKAGYVYENILRNEFGYEGAQSFAI